MVGLLKKKLDDLAQLCLLVSSPIDNVRFELKWVFLVTPVPSRLYPADNFWAFFGEAVYSVGDVLLVPCVVVTAIPCNLNQGWSQS